MTYVRTTKGQSELEAASRALPQRLRMILLLVDGRRTSAQLQAMLATATPGTLSELVALGYISVAAEAAAPAAPPKRGTIAAMGTAFAPSRTKASDGTAASTSARKSPSTATPSRLDSVLNDSRFQASRLPSRFGPSSKLDDDATLVDQREKIARSLARALGPTAAVLVSRVRAASSAQELQTILQGAVQSIANARGQDMADEFASRYGNLESI